MRFVSMDDSPMLRKQVSTGPISGMQGCPAGESHGCGVCPSAGGDGGGEHGQARTFNAALLKSQALQVRHQAIPSSRRAGGQGNSLCTSHWQRTGSHCHGAAGGVLYRGGTRTRTTHPDHPGSCGAAPLTPLALRGVAHRDSIGSSLEGELSFAAALELFDAGAAPHPGDASTTHYHTAVR